MASIEVFKGREPYMLFYLLKTVMLCQASKFFGRSVTKEVWSELYADAGDVMLRMYRFELDDVTVGLVDLIRIEVVDALPETEYVKSTCNISYEDDMWKFQVLRTALASGSGHYRCAMRVETDPGFWNRSDYGNSITHTMATVRCKLHLIVKERVGDMVPVKRPGRWREMLFGRLFSLLDI